MHTDGLINMSVTVPDTATDDDIVSFLHMIAQAVEAGVTKGKECGGYWWKLDV